MEEYSHILPLFDQTIAELLHSELRGRAVPLYLGLTGSTCHVILSDGTRMDGDIVIVATAF